MATNQQTFTYLQTALEDPKVFRVAYLTLLLMLEKIDPRGRWRDTLSKSRNESIQELLELIKRAPSEEEAVQTCRSLFAAHNIHPPANAERKRAEVLAHIIRPFVQDPILDFGCGSGLTSHLLSLTAAQYDVFDGRFEISKQHPFFCTLEALTSHVQQQGKFGTILLVEVLHHVEDPAALLQALSPLTRQFIIIEPVTGHLVSRPVQALMDWIYVRVALKMEMSIPDTWKKDHEWLEIFHRLGLHVLHQRSLGIVFPHAPEDLYEFVLSTEDPP